MATGLQLSSSAQQLRLSAFGCFCGTSSNFTPVGANQCHPQDEIDRMLSLLLYEDIRLGVLAQEDRFD